MWGWLIASAIAAPTTLTTSGRALDSTGNPLAANDASVVVSIYGDAAGSGLRFQETFTLDIESGYYALTLSTDDGDGLPLDTDDLLGTPHLGVQIDGLTAMQPQPLSAVPMSARAVVTDTVAVDTAAGSVPCTPGALVFDTTLGTSGRLRVCNGAGSAWVTAGAGGAREIVTTGGARQWSDGSVAANCEAYRRPGDGSVYAGDIGSGVYTIDPDGDGHIAAFTTWCEMDTAGGGWTLVYAHNYQQADRTMLRSSSVSQMASTRVDPNGPSDTVNFRLPLSTWASIGRSSELLWRAKGRTTGTAPDDVWIRQTHTGLDPSYILRTDDLTQIDKSHACLNETVVAVHTAGRYAHTGSAGTWANHDCADGSAVGVPWPSISCWCVSMGSSTGRVTPQSCGTSFANGNLFFNTNDIDERCSSDQTGLSQTAYANVLLYLK